MKIRPEIEIFSDPLLCATPEKYCSELYRIDWVYWCHLFSKHGEGKTRLSEAGDYFNLPEKCDQCKEEYLKAEQGNSEIKKIVVVLDEAFKYAGHNCRLTFEQCEKLADAHENLKPLNKDENKT